MRADVHRRSIQREHRSNIERTAGCECPCHAASQHLALLQAFNPQTLLVAALAFHLSLLCFIRPPIRSGELTSGVTLPFIHELSTCTALCSASLNGLRGEAISVPNGKDGRKSLAGEQAR